MTSQRLAVPLWICALTLPILVWGQLDRTIWPWDPAFYGDWSVRLYLSLRAGDLIQWSDDSLHALQMMPPLLVWIGQFFVPLKALTGDVESALLLANVLFFAATLWLVDRLARHLGATLLVRLAAVTTCGGASMFACLNHQYFTEPSQGFAAALSMVAALHAERRSPARNAALICAMLGVAFLSKASSLTFALPALVYIVVVRVATRGDIRPARGAKDILWLAVGALPLVAAALWYGVNWQVAVWHFVQATVGGDVQRYSHAAPLAQRLGYWIMTFADVMTVKRYASAVLLLVVLGALIFSGLRLVTQRAVNARDSNSGGLPPRLAWRVALDRAVREQTLFGFYLAGTIFATLIAYASQINQDPRYADALVPLAAGLMAWALVTLRWEGFAGLVFGVTTASAVAVHAASFGLLPVMTFRWLEPHVSRDAGDREALTALVDATCVVDQPPVGIGVSYPELNANTANFFAKKHALETGQGCLYYGVPLEETKDALTWMGRTHVSFVITVAPDKQYPMNFANKAARPVAVALETDPRFALVAGASTPRFKVYKRIPGTADDAPEIAPPTLITPTPTSPPLVPPNPAAAPQEPRP